MRERSLRLATAPVTWGVELAEAPGNPPWPLLLDEIAQSGVDALELGPIGYLPEDPARLRDALQSRALTAVGSYVIEDLHDPAAQEAALSGARRACSAIAAAGGSVLVVIDRPGGVRAATAGRSEDSPRLEARAWDALLAAVERIAAMAEDFGLRAAVHPHAGTYIEYEDEIERFLEGSRVGLCLDTAHLEYSGAVAHEAITGYGDRLAHLHLKDVDGSVLARVRRERIGFREAVGLGVFCPLGRGTVDLGAVLDALDAAGYEGFATIEQDRVAGGGSPPDELAESVAALTAAAELSSAVRRPAAAANQDWSAR
jgi:inosose dehydratase